MLTSMRNDPTESGSLRWERRNLWDAYARVYDLGVSRLAPYRQMQHDVAMILSYSLFIAVSNS